MAAAPQPLRIGGVSNVAKGAAFIVPNAVVDKPLIVCGTDRRGRPVLIARPSLHVAATEDESMRAVEECMKTVRFALQWLPDGEQRLLAVFDLKETGCEHLDMTFSQTMVETLNRELPNRLDTVAVVNGHWSVHAAWSAIQFFLDADTQERIHFYDELNELEQYIDGDHPYMKRLRTEEKEQGAKLADESESWSWW
mmetsp:Transcript_94376/g.177649  ORF Transcript_94376/g.177649 Transcript_94376/m.177649 type:complete len:196 (+) Transcript_94376:90-677(+)